MNTLCGELKKIASLFSISYDEIIAKFKIKVDGQKPRTNCQRVGRRSDILLSGLQQEYLWDVGRQCLQIRIRDEWKDFMLTRRE